MMDLEQKNPLASPTSVRKVSSQRTWWPALVAIFGVISLNAALLGRNGNKIAALSEHFLTKRQLITARTKAVLDKGHVNEEDLDRIKKNMGTLRPTFGSRNLSEEDGGVVEYTRRRHRALGDYTHIDVSEKFTPFGKWSTSTIYFAFWVFLMFPHWFLPIGRPGIALGGALSMIVWRFILASAGHGPAFDVEKVIFMEPLFLLFGIMLTSIYLEKMEQGGLFDKVRDSLDDGVNWKRSAKIMVLSTIGSAVIMNDSIVLIFSGVVVDLCVRHNVTNSMPYLLSLATTANIGSALTMTGNPHNILIVSLAYDEIGWLEFASNMVLPVIAATILNSTMIFTFYAAELFPGSQSSITNLGIMFAGQNTPEMSALENAFEATLAEKGGGKGNAGWSIWSKFQVVVVIMFLAFFVLGYDVCVVSICAGSILMVIASYKRQHYDPRPEHMEYDADGNFLPPKKVHDMDGNEVQPEEEELITESETTLIEIDYGLLMLFIGQFILVGSFNDTGIPQAFFFLAMGGCAEQMTSVPCVYWFVTIVTILSNIASNVPICQMLAATFPYASPYEWMQISFALTIAGNLTMIGSAANMIVAFQAARVGDRTFTSDRHAPFGIPSTLGCLYIGTFLMTLVHFSPECSVRLGECI